MDEIQEKQLKIINHYGRDKQLDQLVEECSELIQAICKYKRYATQDILHVVEEMADVENIIDQLKTQSKGLVLDLDKAKEYKINREIERIEKQKALKL